MKAIKLIILLTLFGYKNANAKSLVIGAGKQIERFFPIHQKLGESHYLRNLVAPPVVAIDQSQKWVCIVCMQIPTLTNKRARILKSNKPHQEDRLETNWIIDSRYNWNDGRPVTAYDIKFTIEKMNKKHSIAANFEIVIAPHDPRSFKIIFFSVRVDYYQLLAISLLPHSKSRFVKKIEKVDATYSHLSHASGIYYGPYQISSIKSMRSILSYNPYYRGLKNNFSRLEFINLVSPTQAKKLMKSAKIDMIADGTFNHSDIADIMSDKTIRESWKLQYSLSSWVDTIQINLKNPYLADINLRKAIYLALNRAHLLADLYDNFGAIVEVPPFFKKNIRAIHEHYNIKEARRLLQASGWELNKGVRAKNGVKLDFELAYIATDTKKNLAEKIRDQLKSVGIRIKPLPYKNRNVFIKDILSKGFYRDLALTTYLIYPEMNLIPYFHSQSIPSEHNQYGGYNFSYWQNKRIDSILHNLTRDLNPINRDTYQKQFNAVFLEYLPSIPLYCRPRFTIFSNQLTNIRFPGHNYHTSLFSSGWMAREKPKDVFSL